MKTLSTLVLSVFSAAALCAVPAFGQEGPGRGEVEIKDVTVNGSGCPVGTATVIITNSKENGPIDSGVATFDSFIVEKPGKDRKFCNIAVDMKFPHGWSYALVETYLPGTAVIQKGVTASVQTSIAFRGTDATAKSKRSQKGYWEGTFNLQEQFDRPVWSPCGKVLPLNLKITASLSGKPELDGEPSIIQLSGLNRDQHFTIRWRRC